MNTAPLIPVLRLPAMSDTPLPGCASLGMLCSVSPPGSTPSRSRTTPACAAWLAPCGRGRMAVKGRLYTPWSTYCMEDEVRQAIGETMAEDMPHALARL